MLVFYKIFFSRKATNQISLHTFIGLIYYTKEGLTRIGTSDAEVPQVSYLNYFKLQKFLKFFNNL